MHLHFSIAIDISFSFSFYADISFSVSVSENHTMFQTRTALIHARKDLFNYRLQA